MAIDQTLPYCISTGVDYFFLTNAVKWQMFKVVRQGKIPVAVKIHEVSFGATTDYEALAEEFYLFSRWSYLNNDWKHVAEVTKATKVEDIVAVMLSDRIIKAISRELSNEHEVKVDEESVYEILEKTILKSWTGDYNEWKYLIACFSSGEVELDNNFIESHIRPFTIGRKNWMFSEKPEGASASANIYSLIEIAKANGLEPFEYLNKVFKKLPMAQTEQDFLELLPVKIES